MHELLFSVQFHLTIFAVASLLMSLFLIVNKILEASNKIAAIEGLSDESKWKKVPVRIENKGYLVNYAYPNMYSTNYGALSSLQMMKASSYEFENYKMRLKKEKLERESGGVTIFYRDERGKLRNRISFSNNPEFNYRTLMSLKDADNKIFAFQNIKKPSIVLLSIPNREEVREEKKVIIKNTLRQSFIYVSVASILCIASLSF